MVVDIFTSVDATRGMMMKWFKKKEPSVDFCDRCSSVCDAACRSDAIRQRAQKKAMRYGGRFA
jgi:hypothetical protein